ncbi:OadG family protein [Clostridium aminobutyricum]|uniref:OadG family protein n=1 Tax=Clostridium aminobutyricum TaxID=33953 RepID=A0A939DAY3_CLOAM|nr:OadG family protein [Clostridium aminobutyricum]MBN7774390.1 OadG family protein [Clostridium aminobutyricum]
MSLMEKFADPALIDTLTSGEKATGALITTFMGMGITFVVLTLLWGTIGWMNKVVAATATETTGAPTDGVNATAAFLTGQAADSVQADEQLVAVITAAIAAYEGADRGTGKLVVRKITRVKSQASAWANAGTVDCIKTRKF